MYRIRGSDQKEYGPISADQLRQWIAQNRANGQTLVQADGAAEWKPLAQFAEFANALPSRPAASPMGVPGVAPKTSGLAIASLVCACLGFCGITAILGLIFGIVAQRKIKQSNGQLTGGGLALAGIIVSAVLFIPGLAFTAGLFLPAFASASKKAQTIQCVNKVKQLGLAVRIYANDNEDKFPAAATWCDDIKLAVGTDKVYQCNAGDAGQRSHYAFNARLSGLDSSKVDPTTVMIYEVEGGWNVSGGSALLKRPSRHRPTYVIGFADGSVQQMSEARLSSLRWDP